MTERIFTDVGTLVCAVKESVQFILRKNIRNVLLFGWEIPFGENIRLFANTIHENGKLTKHRSPGTLIGLRFIRFFRTPVQDNLTGKRLCVWVFSLCKGCESGQAL